MTSSSSDELDGYHGGDDDGHFEGEWERCKQEHELHRLRLAHSAAVLDRNNNASGGESVPQRTVNGAAIDFEEEPVRDNEEAKRRKGEEVTQKIEEELARKDEERAPRKECVPIRILNTILIILCFAAFIGGLLVTLYQEALRSEEATKVNATNPASNAKGHG